MPRINRPANLNRWAALVEIVRLIPARQRLIGASALAIIMMVPPNVIPVVVGKAIFEFHHRDEHVEQHQRPRPPAAIVGRGCSRCLDGLSEQIEQPTDQKRERQHYGQNLVIEPLRLTQPLSLLSLLFRRQFNRWRRC